MFVLSLKWTACVSGILLKILLLIAGIEQNPGPPSWPCSTCKKSAHRGSIKCTQCAQWVHTKFSCSKLRSVSLYKQNSYACPSCVSNENQSSIAPSPNLVKEEIVDADEYWGNVENFLKSEYKENEDLDEFEEKFNFDFAMELTHLTKTENVAAAKEKFVLKKCTVPLVDIMTKLPQRLNSSVHSAEPPLTTEEIMTKLPQCLNYSVHSAEPPLTTEEMKCREFVGTKRQLICSQCKFSTSIRSELMTHLLKKHLETDLPTELGKKFYQRSYVSVKSGKLEPNVSKVLKSSEKNPLVTDLPTNLDTKTSRCSYTGCSVKFASKRKLADHVDNSHKSRQSRKKCSFSNGQSSKVKLPYLRRRHSCPYKWCNYSSVVKELLHAHLANQHGQIKYLKNCAHCPYSTVLYSCLKLHLQSHLPYDQRSIQCSECAYGTSTKQSLLRHMAARHGKSEHFMLLVGNAHKSKKGRKNCAHCPYSTLYNSCLKLHLQSHLPYDQRSFQCSECAHGTSTKQKLLRHIAAKHGKSEHFMLLVGNAHKSRKGRKNCAHCPYSTLYNSRLKLHLQSHLPYDQRSFQCSECAYGTSTKQKLLRHMACRHGKSEHVGNAHKSRRGRKNCAHCPYSTLLNSCLKLHLQSHLPYDQRSFQCSECAYGTSTKQKLLRHIAARHGKSEHFMLLVGNAHKSKKGRKNCAHCPYSTLYNSCLKLHLQSHLPYDQRSFQCSECAYGTSTKQRLLRHMAARHGKSEHVDNAHQSRPGRKKCPRYPFSSGQSSKLKLHLQTHLPSDQRSFQCSYNECAYGTFTKLKLLRHMATVHDESEHFKWCAHCDYKTVSSKAMKCHVLTHLTSIELSFKCSYEECTYFSQTKRQLLEHSVKNHTESDLKWCSHSQCSYSTVNSARLKDHIQTHLPPNLRPLQCPYEGCDYGTHVKVRLRAHLSKKHGETKHLKKCPYCDYKSVYRNHMKTHINGYHKKIIKKVEKIKLPKCPHTDCDFEAPSKQTLTAHLIKNHGESQHLLRCPHCDQSYMYAQDLKRHIEIHLPDSKKSFSCSYKDCGYSTPRKYQIDWHEARQHGETKNLKKCPHSNCVFTTLRPARLRAHIKRYHSGYKSSPYKPKRTGKHIKQVV